MATPTSSDRLNERIRRYASIERLMLMRNLGYGGAATCLVVLVGLAQVGAKELPLKVSVLSASIALPMWLLVGGIYEFYIFLGKRSYPHLRSPFAARFVLAVATIAGVGSVGATGGVIYFLMPIAAWAFAAAGVAAIILGGVHQVFLARWWFAPSGPGGKEEEPDVSQETPDN